MEKRIKGRNIDINYKDTLDFFNSRGSDAPLKHKYNYVLFQDEHPELAIERDKYEKNKICNIIEFKKEDWVLDVGCGIGRWGEEILKRGLNYVGIDYSKQLLNIAADNLKDYKDRCKLIHCAAQDLMKGLSTESMVKEYDKVFVNGVMMYLNDKDLDRCLEDIAKLINRGRSTIYIKETVGTNERLTLNNFYSEDLKHEYTAIYRTAEEYENILKEKFVKIFKLNMLKSEDLFSDNLKNRAETKDYYFILN